MRVHLKQSRSIRLSALAAWLICLSVSVFFAPPLATSGSAAERDCSKLDEITPAQKYLPRPPRGALSTDLVLLRIAGVRYAIPENYFVFPPVGCDADAEDFLIRATYPGLEGATPETLDLFSGSLNDRTLQILVSASRQTGHVSGFMLFFHAKDDPGVDDGSIYGLERRRYTSEPDWVSTEHVALYRKSGDEVTDYIACRRHRESGEYRTCKIFLLEHNAQIQTLFPPKFLSEWQEIKQSVLTLLDRFIRSASK